LIFAAKLDTVAPIWISEKLRDTIQGESVEMVVSENIGHSIDDQRSAEL